MPKDEPRAHEHDDTQDGEHAGREDPAEHPESGLCRMLGFTRPCGRLRGGVALGGLCHGHSPRCGVVCSDPAEEARSPGSLEVEEVEKEETSSSPGRRDGVLRGETSASSETRAANTPAGVRPARVQVCLAKTRTTSNP